MGGVDNYIMILLENPGLILHCCLSLLSTLIPKAQHRASQFLFLESSTPLRRPSQCFWGITKLWVCVVETFITELQLQNPVSMTVT